MKVCLVTFNAKYIHKALALRWLYVARDKQHDTEIVEFSIRDDLNHCVQVLVEKQPDVIGLSVYIWNVDITKQLILEIKKILPNVRILIGGPEVSYECQSWLEYPIEAVLRGEGEKTFWQAVNQEEDIDGYFSHHFISDISYAKVDIKWLETLESPYFLSFDLNDFNHRYFYFETSRGCPYRCAYCLSSLDQQVRFFSSDYLKKQLVLLEKYTPKQVKLLDRTFNADPKTSLAFLEYLEDLDIKTSFQFEIVADTLKDEMLDFLLNRATESKYRFEIGVQSFYEPTLKAVNRTQNNKRCKEVIHLLTNRGYQLHVDLIAGLPFEDLKQFENSFNELYSTSAKEIQVGILKLLKGTSLRNNCDQYGIKFDESSPYRVEETHWMKKDELQSIEDVYHACELLLNNGRCADSFRTFVQLGLIQSPFSALQECGKQLSQIKQLQIKDCFEILYTLIEMQAEDINLIKAILLTDYHNLFTQKPKRILNDQLDQEIRKKIQKISIEQLHYPEQLVYNYSGIYTGFHNNEIQIQMLLYSNDHSKPKRIWFNSKGQVQNDE